MEITMELNDLASELYKLNEKILEVAEALLSRSIDDEKRFSDFLLQDPEWQQVKRYRDQTQKAQNMTDIQNLLAAISEGKR